MDALPIVQYYHGAEPPDYVSELTDSFARLNPGRDHILFNRQSAGDFIAECFGRREADAFEACGPPAMQADYLRYCAVFHYGGVWCDADYVCARDMTELLEESNGGELFISPRRDDVVMNSFFAFGVSHHPLLRLVIDFATELIDRRWRGVVSTVTGPRVITLAYHLCRAGSVDAFLELVREREPGLQSYARVLCDQIGHEGFLASASAGIRAHPSESRFEWIRRAERTLPWHHPSVHWKSAGMEIYADSPST